MTVNRNNFEAYLLDYLEGNLDPLLTADLMAFLAENPEYEKFIPDFDISPLKADSDVFENKETLRKDFRDIAAITQANFDEFCIAETEGLLSDHDRDRLHAYINDHPGYQQHFEWYRMTKLLPDLTVQFEEKSRLKKRAKRSFISFSLYTSLALAASVTLVLLLFFSKNQSGSALNTVSPSAAIHEPAVQEPVNPAESVTEIHSVDQDAQAPSQNKTWSSVPQKEATPQTPENEREIVQLAYLEPVQSQITVPGHAAPEFNIPTSGVRHYTEQQNNREPLIPSESLIGSLIEKIDFWKTAETAISGFNYITESQLSISKTLDDQGNLTELLINTESYSIAGNLK